MRLLFVNHRLTYSSASSYTMDLAAALAEEGDEVRLCTLGGDLLDDVRRWGIRTYRVRTNLFSYWKLVEFLRSYNPDLIHVQSLSSLRLGRRLAQRLGKPYIVTVHRRPDPEKTRLEGKLLSGVIAFNEVIRETLVNHQILPKGLIRVMKRGVRVPQERPQPPAWSAGEVESEESGAPEAPKRVPVVGSVGRLSRDKGHHCLIAAAAKVIEHGTRAHFAIVGEGEEESRLRALVKKLGLQYQVTFSPHLGDREDVYRLFDIVALPVLSSGVGVTALEAMAMGKPLIASAVGEMLHLVQDGRTGILVPEDNADMLARKIIEVIGDPELAETLGRQARAWVKKNFDLREMISETRAYYEETLSGLREGSRLESAGTGPKR